MRQIMKKCACFLPQFCSKTEAHVYMTKGAVPETWILENGEIDAKHAADQQERALNRVQTQ